MFYEPLYHKIEKLSDYNIENMEFLMPTVILCGYIYYRQSYENGKLGNLLCSLSKNMPLSHHSIKSSAKLAGGNCLGERVARFGASAEYFLLHQRKRKPWVAIEAAEYCYPSASSI